MSWGLEPEDIGFKLCKDPPTLLCLQKESHVVHPFLAARLSMKRTAEDAGVESTSPTSDEHPSKTSRPGLQGSSVTVARLQAT